MDDITATRKRNAATMTRDTYGQFSSTTKSPPQPAISASFKVSSPPLKPASTDLQPDTPLVSISIDNPFKRLLRWLDEIRKKQTTELDLKLKLPLVVTLSSAAMALGIATTTSYFYNWGKYIGLTQARAESTHITVSRIGKIISTQTASGKTSRYLFVQGNGDVYIISTKSPQDPQTFLGRTVLMVGAYDEATNTITPADVNGIEIVAD